MIRKFLLLLECAVLVAGLLVAFAAWQQHSALQQPLALPAERLVDVPKGSTPGGMLNQLEAEGVLDKAFWLRLYWRFNLKDESLHSGEYRLQPGMTVRDMLQLWRNGEVVQYSLTLVEGWNFRQVRSAFAKQTELKATLGELSDAELMERLGEPGVNPEGRFFPDTYQFVRGMSDFELLKQAHTRLQKVLDEEWQQRAADLPYKTPYEALIMASMIEKETGVPHEREQIAGVFIRRLAIGMRLQTDPTVIYGMGERYKGRITRADLREPTPYNTYQIDGMPPTPIALVGREAIHAALHPAEGKSLYFVARGDGSHVFSNSLNAHNKAVREYQLKRRADYRSSPAPSEPEPQKDSQ
ncbi:MAG: endolytic transglycosylase MltG [Pseudomonadaceae bacterium]|nr:MULTISPECIES: endolytic transglycosylase MltG [Pseudomonas]MBQ55613.1 endolytic transglycosylase MltG [Pseudomonadaceae bacterium]OEO23556.1 aminodeoxychorismate lyase [Pseudomonas sp. J237]